MNISKEDLLDLEKLNQLNDMYKEVLALQLELQNIESKANSKKCELHNKIIAYAKLLKEVRGLLKGTEKMTKFSPDTLFYLEKELRSLEPPVKST